MKIDPHIIDILESALVEGNNLVLTAQLDRKDYEATNKVLVSIGGKWNKKAKAHVFDEPVADVLEPILLTGTYTRTKQDFGQFDTPVELARTVVGHAQIRPNMLVLEPSAGIGRLVGAVIEASDMDVGVRCYELDPKRAAKLRERFGEIQVNGRALIPVVECDFLTRTPLPIYDRVVMNPPFAKQADIDHVMHAFNFLAPGGRLVAIMSASVTFRTNSKTAAFRIFVETQGGFIEPIPELAFKESGTGVNTVMVVMDKAD